MIRPSTPPPQSQTSSKPSSKKCGILYKSRIFQVNSQHKVVVSCAKDGPTMFTVQLVSEAKEFQQMMYNINTRSNHCRITGPPLIGTMCLGQKPESFKCRAIIVELLENSCKLCFIDFGDTALVSYCDIFDIPEEFVNFNVFAIKFCLSKVQTLNKSPQLIETFKQFVDGMILTLKVVPPEGPPLIQYCELYLDNKNVLDLLPQPRSQIKATTPNLNDGPDSFSSPKRSVPDYGRKKGLCRGSYNDGNNNQFAQRDDSSHSRDKQDWINRPGPSRHSESFNGQPDRNKRDKQDWINRPGPSRHSESFSGQPVRNERDKQDWINRPGPSRHSDSFSGQPDRNERDKQDWINRPGPSRHSESFSGQPVRNERDKQDWINRPGPSRHSDSFSGQPDRNERDKQDWINRPGPSRHSDSFSGQPDRNESHNEFNWSSRGEKRYNLGDEKENRNQKPYKDHSAFNQVQYKELSDPVPLDTPFTEPVIEPGSQHEVFVTWIVSPENFYVQILSQELEFRARMNKIPELYKGVRSYTGPVPVGASVLARYPADGVLYRATVVSVLPLSKFVVRFVDYGNRQLVDAKDIWQIDRQMMELPKMTVQCSLIGVRPVDDEWKSNSEIDSCFNAPRYQCMFQELTEDQHKVSLWNNGVSVADMLVEKRLAVMSEQQSSVTLKDEITDEAIDLTIIQGQQILCRVTHLESFEKFYVQLDLDKVASIETYIANYDPNLLTPLGEEMLAADTHCMVNHEGKIYRAVLQDTADTTNITALLADYGNVITTTLDKLMTLLAGLYVYYYQRFECCFNNYTQESKASLSLVELKERLTGNKFIIYINRVDENILVTTLYDKVSGEKIALFEPDEGAYERVVPLCERSVFNYNFGLAYISHVENLDEIYLQKSADGDKIAQLLDELFKFYEEGTPEPLTTLEVDELCAAKSSNGNWYRATMLNVTKTEVKVRFLDYGNTETVSKDSLKKLDIKFYEPCALAFLISLQLAALQEDALPKLLEWTNEKKLHVTFGADRWLASLHLDGVDLSMKLVNENLATPQIISNEEPMIEPVELEEPTSLLAGCTQDIENVQYVHEISITDVQEKNLDVTINGLQGTEKEMRLNTSTESINEVTYEELDQTDEVATLQPDHDDSIQDCAHAVIENKSFDGKLDNLNDDVVDENTQDKSTTSTEKEALCSTEISVRDDSKDSTGNNSNSGRQSKCPINGRRRTKGKRRSKRL